MRFEDLGALVRQLDGVGPSIVPRPATLQHALFEHPTHDVGERRAVDAGSLDELRLVQALVQRNRQQDGVLPRRQIVAAKFGLK